MLGSGAGGIHAVAGDTVAHSKEAFISGLAMELRSGIRGIPKEALSAVSVQVHVFKIPHPQEQIPSHSGSALDDGIGDMGAI
jgi:hypothetical protein